jgi:hypothetical protein
MKSQQGRQAPVCCICSVPVRLPEGSWSRTAGDGAVPDAAAGAGPWSSFLNPGVHPSQGRDGLRGRDGNGVLDRAVRSMAKTMLSDRTPKNFRS